MMTKQTIVIVIVNAILHQGYYAVLFLILSNITRVLIYMLLQGPGYCKVGWVRHEEHCYFFNKTGETWMNSKVGSKVLKTDFLSHKE